MCSPPKHSSFDSFFCNQLHPRRQWHPTQYSRLENPMVGGAWWAAVHGVAKGRTQLSDFTFTFHFCALEKETAAHSSVLAWRMPGTGGLVGCRLWGRTESDTTEVTEQQQQQHSHIQAIGEQAAAGVAESSVLLAPHAAFSVCSGRTSRARLEGRCQASSGRVRRGQRVVKGHLAEPPEPQAQERPSENSAQPPPLRNWSPHGL